MKDMRTFGIHNNKFSTRAFIVCVAVFTISYCFGQPKPQNPAHRKYNPSYHYYPSGDPTGLFFMGNKYYNNWGAAYSTDLVHWKYSPGGFQALRLLLNDSSLSRETKDSLRARIPRLGG